MTDIHSQIRFARNDVTGAGQDIQHSDCRYQAPGPLRLSLHGEREFRRSAKSVVAHLHWHGSGMICLAEKTDTNSGLAGYGVDDSDREVLLLENRSLLDMDLDVADQPLRLEFCRGETARVATEILDGFGHRDTITIL